MSKKDKFGSKNWRSARGIDQDTFYARCARDAQAGEVTEAEEMLHGFCEFVQKREPIPQPILTYLYLAFARYLDGSRPIENALNLTKPKHRPKGTHTRDPVTVVCCLYWLIKKHGFEKNKAKDVIQQRFSVSSRTTASYDKDLNRIRKWSVPDLEARLPFDTKELVKRLPHKDAEC